MTRRGRYRMRADLGARRRPSRSRVASGQKSSRCVNARASASENARTQARAMISFARRIQNEASHSGRQAGTQSQAP